MKKSMKKVDKIVTGLIIGGAVASIFGVASQTKKGKEVTAKGKELTEELSDAGKEVAKKGFSLMGKGLVKVISLFDKDKK